ncbi:MAG: peptide chain release factor N(5)-glutamine methyltransferase [Clostridiales bacterium]|nr:peptide chain release factor N(5)-glutamine methyltransferase [Clostridiales bacterium]
MNLDRNFDGSGESGSTKCHQETSEIMDIGKAAGKPAGRILQMSESKSKKTDLTMERQWKESRFGLSGGVSLRMACTAAEHYLASCQIEDAAVDAWYLLEYVTGVSRATYLADRDRKLSETQRDAYVTLVNKRGAHIPLQHLTGEQEFMGLPFLVSEAVLIPRQDTETLVELALEKIKVMLHSDILPEKMNVGRDSGATWEKTEVRRGSGMSLEETDRYRVLDLCTGSGCIAVSIAKLCEQMRVKQGEKKQGKTDDSERNGLEICASDLSEDALALARENAGRLGADVRFFQSDLFAQIPMSANGFDLIVSNPPYIRTQVIEDLSEEVRLHEPRLALDGGNDGLEFYRRILSESRGYLRSGGWLLLEIGYDQGTDVADLLRQNGFSQVRISKDLAGNDRVVEGVYYV